MPCILHSGIRCPVEDDPPAIRGPNPECNWLQPYRDPRFFSHSVAGKKDVEAVRLQYLEVPPLEIAIASERDTHTEKKKSKKKREKKRNKTAPCPQVSDVKSGTAGSSTVDARGGKAGPSYIMLILCLSFLCLFWRLPFQFFSTA
ncbi:unnamed protein product [Xyrichtys novacula]|uniref:Unnamed protein product n=1 Tax=Xyrichtys novacula TaxID=13765 RepID=A0AAV1EL08_XYRNO|nr:unnamed protein product [Xyrichtys novacula]